MITGGAGASDDYQSALEADSSKTSRWVTSTSTRSAGRSSGVKIWFTFLIQNTAPIHFDHHYAAQTEFGKPLVKCNRAALPEVFGYRGKW